MLLSKIMKNSKEKRSKIEANYLNLSQQYYYIKDAVNFIKCILKDRKNIFISFNGGKDATVTLVLTYLAQRIKGTKNSTNQKMMLEGIFFPEPNPFKQMVAFYEEMVDLFGIKMNILNSKKYAQQLTKLAQKKKVDGIIMGSRREDPYCSHLGLITESDIHKGYPPFIRINPIIKWNYKQVWNAIKVLEIPFCSLYLQGYTSIGNMNNTIKNITLASESNKWIAPDLADPETERICRVQDLRV